jgi:hypothetical protein
MCCFKINKNPFLNFPSLLSVSVCCVSERGDMEKTEGKKIKI